MGVANTGTNNVTELDASGITVGTFGVGTMPIAIAFDGTHMWVVNEGPNTVNEI
jgi:hypothetical protein